MSVLKNNVQLVGRVSDDLESSITESGKKCVRLRIAMTEVYRDFKGEKIVEMQYHNLVAWGSVAETAEKLLKKGIEIIIEGKLINRRYSDYKGNWHIISEVLIMEMFVLSEKLCINKE